MDSFVVLGDICYSKDPQDLYTGQDQYLVCVDGKVEGVYAQLPEQYRALKLYDYRGKLVIPGLIDLHIHAPQYAYRGTGMDLELLDWLNQRTFPEESRYEDLEYAHRAYEIFAEELKNGATTRACVFGTLHVPATELLMDLLEETGLKTFVGKVNMDRNSPTYLTEKNAEESAENTRRWIEDCRGKYRNTRPILTPRFTPSCTDGLMFRLGELQREYSLPVQSHLSENLSEIAWVRELCPESSCYGDCYDQFGLFGGAVPTIMAHCVYSDETERKLMKERGVFIAHCPESNANLSSGIAPIRQYLREGQRIGLGSDVAGGSDESMFRAMAEAIKVSKLRWRLIDQKDAPLSAAEAFYMATRGGGAFWGWVGSFEAGYEADILVVDDALSAHPQELPIAERLERMIYLAEKRHILHKAVAGNWVK